MATYKLACGQDPKQLCLERPDGSWDMAEFEVHVHHCGPCRAFGDRLLGEVSLATEEALATGHPTTGTLALSASAELVIREAIDILSASRHAFRSKQVQRARELLEGLLRAQRPA